jgi:hypothetical protein
LAATPKKRDSKRRDSADRKQHGGENSKFLRGKLGRPDKSTDANEHENHSGGHGCPYEQRAIDYHWCVAEQCLLAETRGPEVNWEVRFTRIVLDCFPGLRKRFRRLGPRQTEFGFIPRLPPLPPAA